MIELSDKRCMVSLPQGFRVSGLGSGLGLFQGVSFPEVIELIEQGRRL